ncbi:hypothetical protein M427DRAFT_39134 [Gonapodya prolifera JEL478]|uniref:Uncharacterized protein n=1 Tax=Gonapodya prolifera (strain JEL478) TaxID=1344416 RepID=A0A138ZY23_GONPJ|nr:hypothetical protein M427DRAFT_39134 [Gonapodya prolifera JEL478]|eukprot:KXS09361.1 hypothetical protein M427DRAFT_39134 [Gonapodya prolifera JEL478]
MSGKNKGRAADNTSKAPQKSSSDATNSAFHEKLLALDHFSQWLVSVTPQKIRLAAIKQDKFADVRDLYEPGVEDIM